MRPIPISVTILTKNSAQHLEAVLQALISFDEVLIYDTGSTDATHAIAERFVNVSWKEGPFVGFGQTHNHASALARHDWILSIDSDEVLTKELLEEIRALELDKHTVYSPWRKNFFNDRWIRWCGWYPDNQIKLYHRAVTHYSEAQVHEAVVSQGLRCVQLKHPVLHYPYTTTADFLRKMQSYSDLFAQQYAGKRKSSLPLAVGRGLWAFFKSYVLKRGFLGGYEGFIISVYNGHTTYYKYLKLRELNAKMPSK